MQKIQASISGFSNRPCTVYALYDRDNQILVINKEADYRAGRFQDCALVSNSNLEDRDALFELDFLNESISSFFEMVNEDKLTIQDGASRCVPSNKIERDGVNENGKHIYRVADEISNGQIAVLAIVWYVSQSNSIATTLDFQDRLSGMGDLLADGMITI